MAINQINGIKGKKLTVDVARSVKRAAKDEAGNVLRDAKGKLQYELQVNVESFSGYAYYSETADRNLLVSSKKYDGFTVIVLLAQTVEVKALNSAEGDAVLAVESLDSLQLAEYKLYTRELKKRGTAEKLAEKTASEDDEDDAKQTDEKELLRIAAELAGGQ